MGEPDLEFFRWYPYDLAESISDNKTIGRYKAEYITEIEAPIYSARLRISELEESDEGKDFFLIVKNERGESNLTVTLQDFNNGGLETAAIAGIVAAVVVLILLAGVAAFFVMKKKQKTPHPMTMNHLSNWKI